MQIFILRERNFTRFLEFLNDFDLDSRHVAFFSSQIALQYYSTLNALQYKRKLIMLNPFIALMHSQVGGFVFD